jgi:hypothetical protein
MADPSTEAAMTVHGSPEAPAGHTAGSSSASAAVHRRVATALCIGVPLLVLIGSFIWLALDHGTPWLWSVVVHESGRYTLGETILYFGHFLREVPIAVAYALFLLSLSGGTMTAGAGTARAARVALAAAAVLVGGAFLVTARSHGSDSALQDLFQYRTRDDLAGFGTHWRYHWLSTLWFGAATALMPVVATRLRFLPPLRTSRYWSRAAWAYFVVVSILLGFSSDILLDPRYAGHQAREVMTHASVTFLLGLGLVLAFSPGRLVSSRPARLTWLAAVAVVLIPAWLAAVSLRGDVMAQGQSAHGLGAMVAAHYFEHALDYLLVLLLLFGGLAARSRRTQPEPGDVANSAAD